MKIYNVIETEDNIVTNINSFPVHEEQFSEDVLSDAIDFVLGEINTKDTHKEIISEHLYKNKTYSTLGTRWEIITSYI